MTFQYPPSASRFSKPLPPRLRSYQAKSLSSSTHEIGSPDNPACLNCEDFDTRVNNMFKRLAYIESHLHENYQDSVRRYDQMQAEVGDLWNTKKKDKHTIHVPLKNLRVEFDASTQSLEECKDGLQTTRQLLQENIHRLEVALESSSTRFRDLLREREDVENKQTTSLKCLISTTRADLLKFSQKGTEELYEARCLRVLCENEVSNAKAELREFQQEAREERNRAAINHEQACEKSDEALNILSTSIQDFEETLYRRIEKRIFQKADFDYMANSSAEISILSANTGIRGKSISTSCIV